MSRFFSRLLPCLDADTDDMDVPDCLLRGASPQYEAGLSWLSKGTEESRVKLLPWGKRPRKWAKLAFFGDDPAEACKPAKNPKRRVREASKALKQPAMGTKTQQALASQRETMKRESVRARSQRRTGEAEARFEQRKLRRKQKHRGH